MIYDCLIVGAGPAGAAAAVRLAQRGWSVALVDVKAFSVATRSVGWLSVRAASHLAAVGAALDRLLTTPIRAVTFFSSDFANSISSEFSEPVGHLVDVARFDKVLLAAAKAAGVKHVRTPALDAVDADEDTVRLGLSAGRSLEGRVLLAADGSFETLAGPLGLHRSPTAETTWCAQLDIPLRRAAQREKKSRPDSDLRIVLGLGTGRAFGYVFPHERSTIVGLSWPGNVNDLTEAFAEFCTGAAKAGLVPAGTRLKPDTAVPYATPAGGALEAESHVAKRTLAIGDAGGFLAAVSNEAIYPAVWSAELASQVVHDALTDGHLQDGLARFDTLWRTTMADYLRMPNTDVRFLWPLVFSNQQMADKMAAAFLTGQNI